MSVICSCSLYSWPSFVFRIHYPPFNREHLNSRAQVPKVSAATTLNRSVGIQEMGKTLLPYPRPISFAQYLEVVRRCLMFEQLSSSHLM